ncbi:winged helix-turn-helix transcriptional regulator [Limosilactobacillus sp. STM2_1]|uniref:Winged helix-turn-helix transcriptional regulator n=1 Tax=Limosilactobacillus rudii TaxID=2759755 RepID=A0A7W3UMQ2_9LACO|nr:MarR family winged helix-turn-helix transcriptional regulator [Limosilactobacillus rudii]MBB1080368.1 winged helix-turn-helix transcriptional regulator [Limosilactobacillus rudii]MBB1098394.1 winged helix-turn-helix transcriptional regulator [Limosilactobacillus rudii]MCD7135402.1 MarR family winged helix-turn-helix transcriptional regulator [Limosilactobacillus rudii]
MIGRLIKLANNKMNQEMNTFAHQYGLTGTQMSIIDFLTHFPGNSCDQHQIESEFGIKRSTTTVLLQRMAKKNLITRTSSLVDHRQKVVTLATDGKKLAPLVSQYLKEYEAKIKVAFSKHDITVVEQFLTSIVKEKK